MSAAARAGSLLLLASLAMLSGGCATLVSSLIGTAVCGDSASSASCREDIVSSGIEADAEFLASAVASAIESSGSPSSRSGGPRGSTSGDEEYEPPAGGAYFHCVDEQGHHVIELVAPSALDARLLCAAQQGVPFEDPAAAALCDCRARG